MEPLFTHAVDMVHKDDISIEFGLDQIVWASARVPPLASDCGGRRRRNAYKLLCHLRSNRKYKYDGNRKSELAVIDFLFHFNTMYGPIRHRFEARNYFRFR